MKIGQIASLSTLSERLTGEGLDAGGVDVRAVFDDELLQVVERLLVARLKQRHCQYRVRTGLKFTI